MYVLSFDKQRIALFDPDRQFGVPFTVDRTTRSIRVGLPTPAELREDFEAFASFEQLRAAATGAKAETDLIARFSKHYTDKLAHISGSDRFTLARIRQIVLEDYGSRNGVAGRANTGRAAPPSSAVDKNHYHVEATS